MNTPDRELVAAIAPTMKQRNAFFDALFYDVGALSDKEKDDLSPLVDQEGTIIVVPPAASGRRIEHHGSVAGFLAAKGDSVRALAIAGVGKGTHPYFDRLHVVTLGAVADLPPRFRRVHQFIGEMDWFGGMNSRLQGPHTRVPNAWHHLNTARPFHLPVEQVLKQQVGIE